MLDLNFVRGNLALVEEKLRARGADPAALLGNFHALDKERRQAITQAETLKARRNELSQQVGQLKKTGQDASALMEETRKLKESLDELDKRAATLDEQMRFSLASIPNLTRDEVPVGRSEEDNVVVKTWGEKRAFDFEPKPHWELGEGLGILDLERAAKLSGARFAVYMGAGARLERALIGFMLDTHTAKHGYTEVLPPFMVNSRSLFGTGQLPKFAEDLFRCSDADAESAAKGEFRDADHWLIPTAEVPVTNLYRDETLDEARLPIALTAYTPCFRAEAGAAGKDTRGIIRQHQFQKVELVKFVKPEESDAEHERLTRDAEEILEALGLPYRRMLLCTGDTGFSSAKTFDLEVWLPGQQLYREISSCSNFEGFQARRANIRYKPAGGKAKSEFVHTLNGSGLAVGRTWLAILENYQQADGSVVVPDALRPYMGGLEIISGQ
ncbi:serine--tRNA ligase [Occallatibacter riparius]|uniref:Serine--tRNA ligase n=1 Tax=Occallatibacter riparius TaxID=1002689 RepID=A0A9J7BL41_9BACT|nr:serine--tRNA ligase [Occallatibacter riparius]UWZ81965.1 serine--tRNA ligase [Occallatibacter riparius]